MQTCTLEAKKERNADPRLGLLTISQSRPDWTAAAAKLAKLVEGTIAAAAAAAACFVL